MPIIQMFRAPVDVVLDQAIWESMKKVLSSKYYILGSEVEYFEDAFAHYCGTKYCVSLANGTDALELALRALSVNTGDRVLVVPNAGFYSSAAIYLVGATPGYVDVSPITLTMDPDALDIACNGADIKAIIVTHLYGQMADIEAIASVAAKHDIPLIEDCAQAHGAKQNSHRAGSTGAIGCFSFYPTKNLGACGDGGAIVSNDTALARRIRELRQYGWHMKYNVHIPGGRNSRMDAIQASILRIKLTYLDKWNFERRSISQQYNDAFTDLPLQLPSSIGDDFVGHLYVIRTTARDALHNYLKKHGIATEIHYPVPDHLQLAYVDHLSHDRFAVSENACRTVLSLPCFPGLTRPELEYIIECVNNFFIQHQEC